MAKDDDENFVTVFVKLPININKQLEVFMAYKGISNKNDAINNFLQEFLSKQEFDSKKVGDIKI